MNRRICLQNIAALGLIPLMSRGMPLENELIKRIIPSSGEKITPVGLGTWRTFDAGNATEELDPLRKVLKTLLDQSGSVVDSSPMYGRSEQVVGSLSTEMKNNDKLFIATKVWTSGEKAGIEQMNRSFALLQRKKIDLMQVHNLVDWQTHLATLRKWKEEGKIRYLGITHYTESAYDTVEQILKSQQLDFMQINYSVASRKAEDRLLPLAKERNVAVIINQPFQEGALFRSVKDKTLPAWAKEFDCSSWAQFFLKFILSNTNVTCVIPGTSKPHHMLDNIGAAYGKLPDDSHRREMIKLINT